MKRATLFQYLLMMSVLTIFAKFMKPLSRNKGSGPAMNLHKHQPSKTVWKQAPVPRYHILVFADAESSVRYRGKMDTLKCYASKHNHTFHLSDAGDPACREVEGFFFKRLCAAYQYLRTIPERDYIMGLDADVAIVNPEHRIGDWTRGRKDVYLFHRFHNNEVTALYMLRNTPYGREFLHDWYNLHHGRAHLHGYSGMNADNGALHWLLGQKILGKMPRRCEVMGTEGRDYYGFVGCVQHALASSCGREEWRRIHIYPHAKGWAYDGWVVNYKWSNSTFMHHAMKNPPIVQNEFGGGYESYVMPVGGCQGVGYKHYVEERVLRRLLDRSAGNLQSHRRRLGYDVGSCVLGMKDI